MAARTLPGIGLTGGRSAGENGWATEMNANLLKLTTLIQASVKSRVTALPGSPANGDIYIVPSPDNRIAVRDDGAWTYYTATEGWRAWVQDEDAQVVWTGTAWKQIAPSIVAVGTFSEAAPTSSQILLDWVFVEDVTFADDFAGSRATVGTTPTSTFIATIQKNGSNVGTVSISTGGMATFATTAGALSCVAGDLLTVVAPASADATIARLRITLKGTR
jgi:hypothetical protein